MMALRGTMRGKRCWTGIMARLATPWRVFLVLILFSLGVTSHDMAMASGPMPGDMASMASMDMTMHIDAAHMPHEGGCGSDHCGAQTTQTCCLMGQCLIGVAPGSPPAFCAAAKAEPVAVTILMRTARVLVLPFRPPALV